MCIISNNFPKKKIAILPQSTKSASQINVFKSLTVKKIKKEQGEKY